MPITANLLEERDSYKQNSVQTKYSYAVWKYGSFKYLFRTKAIKEGRHIVAFEGHLSVLQDPALEKKQ